MRIDTLPADLYSSSRTGAREEEAFYAQYDWCLNPILSLRELFQRLDEEMKRAPALTAEWQRAESRINVYLFVCAIASTVDDYLSRQFADLSPIVTHFPRVRLAVRFAERLLEVAQTLRTVTRDRSVTVWRRRWTRCVDAGCEILVRQAEPGDRTWTELDTCVRAASRFPFPDGLWRRRMTLPAAFRNQDLSHHDLDSLARRFIASLEDMERPIVVLGLRTAGAYLAPLVKAHLCSHGVREAAWLTIRPKEGLAFSERSRLRMIQRQDAHVLLVDEPPGTGKTFQLALGILKRYGVPPDRVTFAVPLNPAKTDWTLPPSPRGEPAPRLIALDPSQFYKSRLLEPAALAPLLREYYGPDVDLVEDAEITSLNAHLRAHHRDGFHVRLKRVFAVQAGRERGAVAPRHVLAKSVGWGWLGYHAYLAGTRLDGMVPTVIGLRHGLLLSHWVGGVTGDARHAAPKIEPRVISSYVAARVRRLRLVEDPCFENLAWGRTGWREIIHLLRRAYGLYVGRLKIPALHRELRRYVSQQPTLVDGHMHPDEWVTDGSRVFKTDFEHHAFGKTELNIVDPAYDLGAAVFLLGLSAEAERELVETYARESGDAVVRERIILYKLLHGVLAMEQAMAGVAREVSRHDREAWNRRYLAARAFSSEQLHRFAASRIPTPACNAHANRLFFLDLDGVFDAEMFGFPHTTASGLAALDLLRSHGFSVVLNTGRSVADVHSYCRAYDLPGGVGELGSVFVDAAAGSEMPLITQEAAEQLAGCREMIGALPGVLLDPFYRYSLRAYRFKGERMVPLPPAEVEDVLIRHGFDRLAANPSAIDTIILQRGTDKGEGVRAVKKHLGLDGHPVAAIGDGDRDLSMLRAAEFAYAPAGCSVSVRALARTGGCRVMSHGMQRGLLAAVQDLIRRVDGRTRDRGPRPPGRANPHLLETLLNVAERSRLRQFLSILNWWSL